MNPPRTEPTPASFLPSSRSFPRRARLGQGNLAFTIVELLVVVAIMVVMMALAVPAFNSLKGAGDVSKTAYDVAGTLEQARAYAIANNTYVWVGIIEVDSSQSASATPQILATATTGGRVAVAVVASKDGTRGYDVNNPGTWITNYTAIVNNLVAIGKLQRFENMHMAPSYSTLPTTGNMTRTSPAGGGFYMIGNSACQSVTPFTWPLGTLLPATATTQPVSPVQYAFWKVINFDPQGVARIQYATNSNTTEHYMELGLQPTHGNAIPSASPANVAAIQLTGIAGNVKIYKP